MRYRTKIVEIEAHVWDGDWQELKDWADMASDGNGTVLMYSEVDNQKTLKIKTWEGVMEVPYGNYVICGLEGEFYSCAPSTFEKKYEVVR